MSDGGQERGGEDGWGGVWFGWGRDGGGGGGMTTLWPCLPVSQTHAGQEPNPEHRLLRVKKKKVFGWRGSCVIRVGEKARVDLNNRQRCPFKKKVLKSSFPTAVR